jgi:MarC family membrane protein
MKDLLDFAVLSFGSLFFIVDPIAIVPSFLAMTETNTPRERARMARLASIVTCLVLLIFFVCGESILRIFHVSVSAFQIAGGVLLLTVAMDMLRARRVTTKGTTGALYSFVFSQITIKILTRLMGLLLSAIAVQFILNGIQTIRLSGN